MCSLCSLLIADLVGDGCSLVKVSSSTKEEWLLVISQLYPIVPRPELSLQQLQQVLPVVHKYNFPELLQYVSGRLVTELPSTWSLKPADPGYIIKWLVTAEQLQLDALKEAALGGIKKQCPYQIKRQMAAKVLDADLLNLSPGLMLEALRTCTCNPALWLPSTVLLASVAQGGGLTLDCDDGELSVLRDVFAVSSPLMADLLSTGCTLVKVSGSTKEEWLLVISQLYPIIPHPELSLPQLQQVLPVVHKYNFLELLQYVNGRLVTELPSCWSLNPSAPGYIIKWLVMAEQLQLDALKQAALEGLKKQPPNQIKGQMAAKVLDVDLLCLSPGLMLEALSLAMNVLPAPVWDDEQDDTQQRAPVKRAHQQVTGAVVSPRGRPGGSKAARPGEPAAAAAGCTAHGAQHTASAPGAMTTAAAAGLRLPPQLRGRPNVSTEDVDKLFTSPRLAAAKAKAQPTPLQ
ncbi:hypothetical protein V8C86DRAFT_3023709 [Haematococcus lacustris]